MSFRSQVHVEKYTERCRRKSYAASYIITNILAAILGRHFDFWCQKSGKRIKLDTN